MAVEQGLSCERGALACHLAVLHSLLEFLGRHARQGFLPQITHRRAGTGKVLPSGFRVCVGATLQGGGRSGSISPSPALLEPDSEELRGPSERVSCPGGRLRAWRSVGKLSGSRVLVDRVRSRGTWRPRRGQPRSIVGLQDGLWGAAPGSAGPGTELLWSESLISTAKRNCESSCVK